MTLYSDLQALGLTANQSAVYLALYRSGRAKAGDIIKKTGIHRNLVYTALDELIDKKLVTSSKQLGVSVYKPLSPTRLLAEPHEKERIARNAIEELTMLSKKSTSGQEIAVREGIDEFRRQVHKCFAETKPKGLIRYLGLSPRWHEIIGPELESELIRMQNEKGFKIKALAHVLASEDKEYAR